MAQLELLVQVLISKNNRMKAVLGFILFAVAVTLYVPLTILNIPFVLWGHRKKRSFLKNLNGYFLDEAVSIDIHGNRSMRALWNSTMRKSNGYRFGREGETISSALGKNQRDGTLSFIGKLLAGLLDLLDKDHCKKSIKNLRTERIREISKDCGGECSCDEGDYFVY